MSLSALLSVAIFLFPVSEIALAIRRRASGSDSNAQDRGSMWTLWIAIILSVVGSTAAQRTGVGRMPRFGRGRRPSSHGATPGDRVPAASS